MPGGRVWLSALSCERPLPSLGHKYGCIVCWLQIWSMVVVLAGKLVWEGGGIVMIMH